MSRLTDKIRSNGNPFATPSSPLLHFRPFGDFFSPILRFLVQVQFPQILSVSLRVSATLAIGWVRIKRNARNYDLTFWTKWRITCDLWWIDRRLIVLCRKTCGWKINGRLATCRISVSGVLSIINDVWNDINQRYIFADCVFTLLSHY